MTDDHLTFEAALAAWNDRMLQRAMQAFWQFTREAGISAPQMQTLMRLHYRGECNVSDVGSHLDISNPAASQLIQRLVADGLVARQATQNDRRTKTLTLTAKGQALVDAAIATRHAGLAQLAAGLGEAEKERIRAALLVLLAAGHNTDNETPRNEVAGQGETR